MVSNRKPLWSHLRPLSVAVFASFAAIPIADAVLSAARFLAAGARMPNVRLLFIAALLPITSASSQHRLDLTGRPDATIGEPFTMIAGVRELPGQRALVTDQMDRFIVLVDFTAGTREPVGRQGDGPGEYRFPTAPLPGVADTTWVVDGMLRRILRLTPDGRIAATALAMPTGGVPGGLARARGTDRHGRFYFEGSGFDQERGAFIDSVAVVRWNPADGRTEVITRVSNGGRVRLNLPSGASSLARSITPFPHLDAWAVLPDGQVVIVHHNPFRIDVVDAAGNVRRGTVQSFTPIAVSAVERAQYRRRVEGARVGALRVGGGSGPQSRAPELPDEAFPNTMPPFIAATVLATPEGEIWVGRSHAAADRTWRYDIFDATGRLLGTATLRNGAVVAGFGAGTVYVARTDPADDLVYLERYRR